MFLMYVDESGDTGFPKSGAFPPSGGPTTHFVRVGVVVHSWKWWSTNEVIKRFKESHGLAWDSEIRAHDIRANKGAFSGWNEQDRAVFLSDFLDTVEKELDVSIIAVSIDKTKVDASRAKRYSDPSVCSFEFLLERYNSFLGDQKDGCGLVILDSVEASNDENLRYFQSFLRERSNHLDARRIVEGALFMRSHTTNLLQLADVCANVLYRHYSGRPGAGPEQHKLAGKLARTKEWP